MVPLMVVALRISASRNTGIVPRTATRIIINLPKETVFPKIFTQLVSVGEQSGSLDTMFGSASKYMNKEFTDIAENFNTILEPVIIVIMGVVVGGLLIALYTPMFNMGALIQ